MYPTKQAQSPSVAAFLLIVVIQFWVSGWLTAAAPADPLWQKALAVAQANADWIAGLVVMRSEVVYKGETNGVHEIWKRAKLGTHGEVVTETVKVLEDGKDVTAKEKKKEKGKRKNSGQGAGNPFSAESQDHLFLSLTNHSRRIAGQDCVGYVFEVRNTNGPKTRGVAWLESETGAPAELENVTLDPVPDKRLKRMTITTRYESTAEGAWHVKEMRTTGKISLLFIHAEVQSTMTFGEYWKKPPRQGTKENGEL